MHTYTFAFYLSKNNHSEIFEQNQSFGGNDVQEDKIDPLQLPTQYSSSSDDDDESEDEQKSEDEEERAWW